MVMNFALLSRLSVVTLITQQDASPLLLTEQSNGKKPQHVQTQNIPLFFFFFFHWDSTIINKA